MILALKLCIFLGILSVILFMMSLLSFILFFEVCKMNNTDFVFVANTKAFRRFLSLYDFKFSILSFSKVEICKNEIYLRVVF